MTLLIFVIYDLKKMTLHKLKFPLFVLHADFLYFSRLARPFPSIKTRKKFLQICTFKQLTLKSINSFVNSKMYSFTNTITQIKKQLNLIKCPKIVSSNVFQSNLTMVLMR